LLIGKTLSDIPSYIDKIYAIDDGSPDNTLKIINEYSQKDQRIVPIAHEINKGVGAAIVSGYKKAIEEHVDIAVVMAGDNQMDPKYITSLLDPIIEGKAGYTKGNRLTSIKSMKGMSLFRRTGNIILTYLTKISSGYWNVTDPQNGYTAVSGNVLKNLSLDEIYPSYGYCNDLLVKMNVLNIKVLDVDIPARYGNEKSKIKYSRYIFKLSWLLLKDMFWRLKIKYVFSVNIPGPTRSSIPNHEEKMEPSP
jgi:glycosyltransferase involved in cell wall biosynthesis